MMSNGGASLWVVVILLAIVVVGALAVFGVQQSHAGRDHGEALRILDERLAGGEITVDEFRERAAALVGTTARHASTLPTIVVALMGIGVIVALTAFEVRASSSGAFDGMRDMMRVPMMADSAPQGSAARPVVGARTVTVTVDEWQFTPATIHVPASSTVNFVLRNRGDLFHTLTVTSLGFELRADGGTSATGSLRTPAPGRYPFMCTVPGHAQAGMHGTLIVDHGA